MTKFLKVLLIIFLSFLAVVAAAFATFAYITKDAKLDPKKLITPERNVLIYDNAGNEIVSASASNKQKSVNLKSLPEHVKNAFIASEDRTFYSHNGLNYRRMVMAALKNISARSFKQGASTISQQLVKNTHLTGDKTIKRKLNEIKLTKKLEKLYTKDQILEMYLNTIYFGHSCYGLESAAEFYFDKKAENLTLEESATLAGLLTSPNNFSPYKNPEKSLLRRNTVLKCMLGCSFLDTDMYKTAISSPLNTAKQKKTETNSDYIGAIFDELENSDISAYNITDGCRIFSCMDADLQKFIENIEYDCDNSVIIAGSDGNVLAYKSTIGGARRQPGSTIKPLAVYAPAIDEKIIDTFTKIRDEKVNFGDYSPENFDKKFHGNVTVADSLKYSYNVPAVKILNSLTVKKAEKYLNSMNLRLEDDEKNLSLALGGMKYGLTLKQICDFYGTFQSGGYYSPSRFIDRIEDRDGNVIYRSESSKNRVFSEGCCSLMNEMLKETTKSGTAKKLRYFDFDIASKTGTCGTTEGNTDAYAVSYTISHRICVWLGDRDNKKLDITGGGKCCNIVKEILTTLYENKKPARLATDSGTATVDLDLEEYEKRDKIILSDPICPKLNKMRVKVLSDNIPKTTSDKFSHPTIKKPQIKVENDAVNISLCQTKYYAYVVNRVENGKKVAIYDGAWRDVICDTPKDGYYTYTVVPYYVYGDKKIFGDETEIARISFKVSSDSPQVKIPDIVDKDWFNL